MGLFCGPKCEEMLNGGGAGGGGAKKVYLKCYGNNNDNLKYVDTNEKVTASELVEMFNTADIMISINGMVFQKIVTVFYNPEINQYATAYVFDNDGNIMHYVTAEYVEDNS